MLSKGQKIGVYPIKDIFVMEDGFGCYLSEDPFFKSKILLNVYQIDHLSSDQQASLKQRLDQLFLLDHPAIVPAIDSGYENGRFYYTTQYYAQDSFKQRALEGISISETKKLFQRLVQALEYGASCNHYHGKIEIEDIVFEENGDVKLLNFGVFRCLDFTRINSASAKVKITETLSSLGQNIQKLVSDRQTNVDDCFNIIINRCLCRGEDQYRSFTALIDDLNQLDVGSDDNDKADEKQLGSAIQKLGGVSISEEQRAKILPYVRELIREKNSVQDDFDAFKLEHEKVQTGLDNALQEAENLTERLRLVTKFDNKKERKKIISSVFTGVVVGLLLAICNSYFFSSTGKVESAETSIVQEMKTVPVLKQAVTAPVRSPETPKKHQPIPQVPVVVEVVEIPQNEVFIDRGEETTSQDVDSSKGLFNVSSAQAAVDVISFDKVEMKAIKQSLTDWSESWARQELEEYFNCYSDRFQPAEGINVETWRKVRKTRLMRPDWIEVAVSKVKINPLTRQRARVFFQQHYRSDRYEDDSYKEVILGNEGGRWRILYEKSMKI